ncbi:MAG: phospholipase C, phosphocholine-specific [Ignavibacteriota bacterium]
MSTPTGYSRRRFLQQTSSGAALATLLGPVKRALAIPAEPGSSYLDAEHVVILMQENRSFDHAFGALRGVRGFNDPRAVTLPDGNPVWLQRNAAGETYAPFRLDIHETNATWLGSLPHSWRDQTDALHHGNHDGWLDAKPSGRKECAGMPLTMGYYDRRDLPFYYALADAFTICDQHFCSSLTGTTPNRLYLWTGTIRAEQNAASAANVRNENVDYDARVRWTTFPERLEDAGVSWKIYQNELSLESGFEGEEDAWLSNFTDNPIEWFEQFHVFFAKPFREFAARALETLPEEIRKLDTQIAAGGPDAARLRRRKQAMENFLRLVNDVLPKHSDEAWAKLAPRERNLHEKAFCCNTGDPDYRKLTTLRYRDGDAERELKAPKGDVLHQFREDVRLDKLPAVSWIVPPENFSDHPGAPWYGAWMVSEVLHILTANPEVWKKTVFVLTYDENDGYFDHVVPFGAPDPARAESGKTSEGIDASVEQWSLERDRERRSPAEARGGSLGLGFRVPLIVASPWSRGGFVCSQVFDHTSVLQLLENVASRRAGKAIRETNISAWRRAVCGDLSSVFRPAPAAQPVELTYPPRDAVLETIHKARFKGMPAGYRKLDAGEIDRFRTDRFSVSWMPQQERGVRPSMPLPYELYANGGLSADRRSLEITLEARREAFGARSAGSPFHAYAPRQFRQRVDLRTRTYAVEPGHRVTDTWAIDGFEAGRYHLCVCGPNGFFREWRGSAGDPALDVRCEYVRGQGSGLTGDLAVEVVNRHASSEYRVVLVDHMQKGSATTTAVRAGKHGTIPMLLVKTFSWYDFTVTVAGADGFVRRCAGRVETGREGYSDPAMGRVV